MSYANDRAWSDRYLPAVRAIVGPMLLVPAPLERDISEATDLIVLRARDMTIGVRLRRFGYAQRFPGEFTIRSQRDSGAKTELKKIVDGWGDWLFYGHASKEAPSIDSWVVVDLHALRAALIRHPGILREGIASGETPNGDGTHFRWFKTDLLPTNVLIGASDDWKCAA